MDAFLFQKINGFALRNAWLDTLGIFFAEYFPYIVAFCLIAFLIWNFKKYHSMVFWAFWGGIGARVITALIRFLWNRPRPFVENHVKLLIHHFKTGSFPSGHAAFFFGIAGVVYFYNKDLGILFFISAFLISIARIFCGIHWPADIAAGFLVGIFSALLTIYFSRKIKKS
ncbi:MAG TPA: phosphatase PAP2 family protein [bacterium]|nr:phosphatase PAP2 family protein [bacterium]